MGEGYPHRMKLSQLRALVAIADTGSFSDAALQMDLSQSAVSHAIATLEEELGVILLSRGRQGAVLTPIGEQITEDARQIMQSLDNIGRKAHLSKGLTSGQVRIAAFRSVATHILPEVIQHFRQKYPGISVAIDEYQHYNQAEDDLRQGRADIGFTYLPTSPEFEAWEVLHDRYIILLPPSQQPPPHPFTWEELAAHPLILGPNYDGDREYIERHLARHGQHLQPAYMVKEDSTILGMVRSGLGASIMARLAAEPIPEGVQIASLPNPLARIIGAIVLADALQPPAVFAFLDTLKAFYRPPLGHETTDENTSTSSK
ncbi:LysR family transcriptional regulator [Pseudanabaena sp. FACHB-2040]|uniref:LysR family transcriptional regulator n=1 Tax=Pseudanabaena sp. FACHB-2040 TaxID=2692859 RepID=UPI00168766E0|nr:LysR family transcriptional regulator [Pseudanabaena sp. FACHB-2040]MBD0269308.1 LysR family transcriptional regulator [Cyanobacteria bacterium Co-bin8]MBD2259813.1 LysR family transcriptional regulator [Pseudanabaena sp. FACHB-2040]